MDRHEAILIIGPTGSGKTPLGDLIEERGLWNCPCAHFDFGRELRRIAAGGDPLFEPDEIAFIREVLDEGRLLEDEHFHIAWKILTAFIAERCRSEDADKTNRAPSAWTLPKATPSRRDGGRSAISAVNPLVVLNGLPRHIGQAGDVDCMVDIKTVIHLNCTPKVVVHRIQTNAGGDRTRRADDALAAVRKKLALFEERTRPLVEHYAALGANVVEIEIAPDTTPETVLATLEHQPDK